MKSRLAVRCLALVALSIALVAGGEERGAREPRGPKTAPEPVQSERSSREPRGPRRPTAAPATTAAEFLGVPGFDMRAYSEWFQAMQREFPRHLTTDDDQDLVRLNARLERYFAAGSDDAGRETALNQWLTAALGLFDYIADWDNAFVAEYDGKNVASLEGPSGKAFLAALENQPFVFVFRNPGAKKMFVLKTMQADLSGQDGLVLTLEPEYPTLFKLFMSGIKPGPGTYEITLKTPRGETFFKSSFQLHGVEAANIKVRILDELTGQPTEALMALFPANGRDMPRDIVPFYTGERTVYTRQSFSGVFPRGDNRVFTCRGEFEMPIYPGPCRVVAIKGPEYRLVDESFEAPAGTTTEKEFVLRRFVNLPERGWYSADDHCHVPGSPRTDGDLMDLLSAVDLHLTNVVQMGDEDRLYFLQSSWGEPSQYWRGDRVMAAGQEDPRTTWRGHVLMFNLQSAIHDRNTYYLYEDALKEARRQGGLVGYTHDARSYGGEPGATISAPLNLLDFVALGGADEMARDVLYHLWNLGFRVTATNGSDFPYGSIPGDRRFFLHTEGQFSFDRAMEAIKAGRTFASNGGAFIMMRVNGQLPGSVIKVSRGEDLSIEIEAGVNPDFDHLGKVELVRFGSVLETFRPASPGEPWVKAVYRLSAERSCWIAGRVFGATASSTEGKGELHRSGAHTSPFYVEVDGKPWWNEENLAAELARAYRQLDEMTRLADAGTPLMIRQKERLLDYVDQARHAYGAIEEALPKKSE